MILSFDKPAKLIPTKEHNEIHVSDSGVNGTYVPNMSKEDTKKFKAIHIKGDDERIEIRVVIGGVNTNIFVFKEIANYPYPKYNETDYAVKLAKWRNRHQNLKISMNGKMDISFDELNKIIEAIEEAKTILNS